MVQSYNSHTMLAETYNWCF